MQWLQNVRMCYEDRAICGGVCCKVPGVSATSVQKTAEEAPMGNSSGTINSPFSLKFLFFSGIDAIW